MKLFPFSSMQENYNKLIGKSKDDVFTELGEGYNYFYHDRWTYTIRRKWCLEQRILIYFENEKVKKIKIKIIIKT